MLFLLRRTSAKYIHSLLLTKCSLPLSLSDSSAISWSDDDSACDFTDRFEKCGRGRRKRVEESAAAAAADAEEKASTEDEDEDEHGDEDRTASAEKKSEKNKETQTSHHAKVEAAPAPVKVGDTLWCLEARPIGL